MSDHNLSVWPDDLILTNTDEDRLFAAFNDTKHFWRTLPGLAKDSGLSYEQVYWLLQKNREKILRAYTQSTSGHELFTTRERWRKDAGFGRKFVASLRGSAT